MGKRVIKTKITINISIIELIPDYIEIFLV